MSKIFIIAEAGVNHNGDVGLAKKMVEKAKEAGCDAVKFQNFKAEKLVIRGLKKADYQIKGSLRDESQFEMLKRLELSKRDFRAIASYCQKKGIIFMSSPFDEENVDFLDELGVELIKIPSGEITNKPLIQHIASRKKPIILSTGMSYLEEVRRAIQWIMRIWHGLKRKPQLTLLHCTSNYPASLEDVNLRAINTLKSTFNIPVGYSDHTLGIEIALAACAMGASVIEKHFTLDKNMDGPDHKASVDFGELSKMVTAIRNIERAFGDGIKRPAKSEEKMRDMFRRSIVAAADIKAGYKIKRKDIAVKRPGSGLSPELIEQVLNKKALFDIKKDSLLQKCHFC